MRTFAQIQNQSQKSVRASFVQRQRRTPESEPVPARRSRKERTQAPEAIAGQDAKAFQSPLFSYNFTRVPVYNRTAPRVQAELAVSTPGDIHEREADSVAESVMGLSGRETREVRRRAPGDNVARTERAASNPGAVTPAVDRALRSPGRQLDCDVREFMEPRFGYDLSGVRIHADDAACKSAQEMRANAYTVGCEIVFDREHYAPATFEGRRLIAHELTHVVQQSGTAENAGVANAGPRSGGQLLAHSAGPMLARQNSTPNPASMTDRELQAEHGRVRQWLLQHKMVETDYRPNQEYFEALEAEVSRRNVRGAAAPTVTPAGTSGPPDAQIRAGSSRVSVPPPGTLFSGPRAPASDRAAPVTASHAGGALGEKELPFALGEQGMHMVITSSGPGSHPLTGHGFDAIAWDPKERELWLIDNKSTGELGPLEGRKATALGPNLESSLAEAVDKVRKIADFPDKAEIVGKLEKSLASIRAGKGIPSGIGVRLKLTNAGGYGGGKGVGARNLPPQTTAEDLVSPAVRKARGDDVAAAKINDAATSRPRSHADTEAARVKVGGAQSREAIVRSLSQKIAIKAKGVAVGVLKNVAVLAWNYLMSKIEQKIEAAVVRPILEKQLVALQPDIEARLNAQVAALADIQMSHPGKPLYANVGIEIVADRYADDDGDETLININTTLTDVRVASEPLTAESYERFTTGARYINYQPHDRTRRTFPMELEPLPPDALRAIFENRISDLEEAEARRSATPEALKASAQERNRLADQLRKLQTP
jgi:hypothetical protein